TDESGLTGESRSVYKDICHPLLMKGTQVIEGDGLMLSVSVGDYTEWGQLMAKLQEDRDDTPLQEKLERLASLIGWIGFGAAALLFIVLVVRWAIDGHQQIAQHLVLFVIMAITIIVVAVPEGLPLAVTISLAYSMKKVL
ncbi:Plasma membrane calcium-transporting ATPase 2, partial [Reticulomyxa filosa]